MADITKSCKMKKSTPELTCPHVIDFGCDTCLYYKLLKEHRLLRKKHEGHMKFWHKE